MRDALPLLVLSIVAPFVADCQSDPPQSRTDASTTAAAPAGPADRAAAYLDGKLVTQAQLYRLIAPAHGGEALAEILVNRGVQDRLRQENIELTQAALDAERDVLLASLDQDPDQAARLLQEMRSQRGLNGQRFEGMLRRNAGLRALVRDQVTINDAAIMQAYQLRYGERYRVRLIVTDDLDALTKARKRALEGRSFIDLAIELSTDRSARQGGLLSPISPADPTYPKAIRDVLAKLGMDDVSARLSPPIALTEGYALLWLEEVLGPSDPPGLDQVRIELEAAVRRDLERVRMRQLAQTLIEQADVVVLDPLLDQAWRRHRESIRNP